ncbi:SIR2 family protein [Candidatus Poribacteria bacterium]|nr:SIR2 family protein [Candidatus Poribacteria bacterium]
MENSKEFEMPEELVNQIAIDQAVIFVGSGVSMAAGLPNWPTLLSNMLAWAEEQGYGEFLDKDDLKSYIKQGELLLVAEELRNRLGKEGFHRFMLEIFRPPDRPSDENQREPIPVHELITEIPFAAALTSNYDSLLESAYARKWGEVPLTYTQLNVPELSASLQGGFYVLKVHGTIHRIETVILSQKDYREIMYANQTEALGERLRDPNNPI